MTTKHEQKETICTEQCVFYEPFAKIENSVLAQYFNCIHPLNTKTEGIAETDNHICLFDVYS